MSKILNFPNKIDPKVTKFLELGKDFDQLMYHGITQGLLLEEIAIIMSHRLGCLIEILPNKTQVLEAALEVIVTESKWEKK